MESAPTPSFYERRHPAAAIGRIAGLVLWDIVRLPVLTLLVILEPFVRTVLMGIAMIGVPLTLFYEFVVKLPGFPFWLMLGLSVGSAMLLLPYYALMRLFSAR